MAPLRRARDGIAAAAIAWLRAPGAAAGPGPPGLGECAARFVPPAAPLAATDLNGVRVPDACFMDPGEHHVYIVGDWGGVSAAPGAPPVPADHRAPEFKAHHREFVSGVDDCAQQRVAEQMRRRAAQSQPDYVLNVGDNFYWGGIAGECGMPVFEHVGTGQWATVFEEVYTGPGLDGKQWLGVLGNHDYGGYVFTGAWDQVISYTWYPPDGPGSTGRWLTPAQYWRTKAWYADFSVHTSFWTPTSSTPRPQTSTSRHNLCSAEHNAQNASCGPEGPASVEDCPAWFGRLWAGQMAWLDQHLGNSAADWQVVVTHYPPIWGRDDWSYLAAKHGIDLIASGHIHKQELHHLGNNFLKPTAYLITGGGGGITSEGPPTRTGHDDQYGFVDVTLSRTVLRIEMVSHGGQLRRSANVTQRHPENPLRLPGARAAAQCLAINAIVEPYPSWLKPFFDIPLERMKFSGPLAASVAAAAADFAAACDAADGEDSSSLLATRSLPMSFAQAQQNVSERGKGCKCSSSCNKP
ncbi:unnamed protein product [Prorocentrum cordatum]|uniref:Calcineurin-like phosphoesterase domain-containing protein n=1 Tax=Prorocentrum cordatum TaxID=2364126 RepID=A0ABN9TWW2_9DINO|nr:unnamed protein product [Polarella glacialis]